MNKLPFIDALRGLAIFGVVIIHTAQIVEGMGANWHLTSWLHSLTIQGKNGVQLFYMISAFTLFLSLNNRKKAEKRPLLNFFIRRFFRIAPMFYCAIAFSLFQNYWRQGLQLPSFLQIISLATFTYGWHPYWINSVIVGSWSVAVEMMFYLLVPYFLKKIKSLYQAIYLTFVLLIVSELLVIILSPLPLIPDRNVWEDFLFYWLPSQLPIFCLGFSLYFFINKIKNISAISTSFKSQDRSQQALLLLLISSFLFIALAFGDYRFLPKHFLYGIDFFILAISLSIHPFIFLVNRFWCYLGTISFSLYLTHYNIISIMNNYLLKGLSNLHLYFNPNLYFVVLLIATITSSIVISSFTYQFIELPGQACGRNLIFKLENRRLPS